MTQVFKSVRTGMESGNLCGGTGNNCGALLVPLKADKRQKVLLIRPPARVEMDWHEDCNSIKT